jgi:hypothetical protein
VQWAAGVFLELVPNGLGVGLDVVLAVDVGLQQQQKPVEPLTVLERVAPWMERCGDPADDLLTRGRGERHVGRTLGRRPAASERRLDHWSVDGDPPVEALILCLPCHPHELTPEGRPHQRSLGAVS